MNSVDVVVPVHAVATHEIDSRLRGNDRIMSLLRKQESRKSNRGAVVSGE